MLVDSCDNRRRLLSHCLVSSCPPRRSSHHMHYGRTQALQASLRLAALHHVHPAYLSQWHHLAGHVDHMHTRPPCKQGLGQQLTRCSSQVSPVAHLQDTHKEAVQGLHACLDVAALSGVECCLVWHDRPGAQAPNRPTCLLSRVPTSKNKQPLGRSLYVSVRATQARRLVGPLPMQSYPHFFLQVSRWWWHTRNTNPTDAARQWVCHAGRQISGGTHKTLTVSHQNPDSVASKPQSPVPLTMSQALKSLVSCCQASSRSSCSCWELSRPFSCSAWSSSTKPLTAAPT